MRRTSDLLPMGLAIYVLFGSCSTPDSDPTDASLPASAASTPAYLPTPEETALLERLSALQAQQGHEEGIALAEAYLEEHPETRRLHYALGIFYGSTSDHRRAQEEFESELELAPDHIDSYRGLAAAHAALGESAEAVAALEKALTLAPDDEGVQLDLGRELSNLGRFERAEVLLRDATGADGAAAAYTELGTLYRRLGRPEEAADAFRAALRIDPQELAAMANLGQTLIAEGRIDEGQALLERHAQRVALKDQLDLFRRSSLLEGVTAANYLRLAELQIRMGKDSEAVESYSRALQLDAKATTATLGLAALFLKDRQPLEATKWTVHTLMIDPQNAKAHFLLGMLRLSKGEIEDARRAFDESRRHRPWDAETFRRAADAFRSGGHLEPALAGYAQALDLDPGRAESHFGKALVEYLLDRPETALTTLDRCIQLAPENANGHVLLGIIRFESGSSPAAEQAFQAALALHRVDLDAGSSTASLLAPFAAHPRTERALARYRQILAGAA